MIYRTCTQLLKKRPILLRIFTRRKIHAVLVTQFLLAEAEERAKGWIDEERLTFQGLHCNSDGTRVENIMEKLKIRNRYRWCVLSHRQNPASELSSGETLANCIPLSTPDDKGRDGYLPLRVRWFFRQRHRQGSIAHLDSM